MSVCLSVSSFSRVIAPPSLRGLQSICCATHLQSGMTAFHEMLCTLCRGGYYGLVLKCVFYFPTVGNTNVTDAHACEVGG
jgi:hypothetical protein